VGRERLGAPMAIDHSRGSPRKGEREKSQFPEQRTPTIDTLENWEPRERGIGKRCGSAEAGSANYNCLAREKEGGRKRTMAEEPFEVKKRTGGRGPDKKKGAHGQERTKCVVTPPNYSLEGGTNTRLSEVSERTRSRVDPRRQG